MTVGIWAQYKGRLVFGLNIKDEKTGLNIEDNIWAQYYYYYY